MKKLLLVVALAAAYLAGLGFNVQATSNAPYDVPVFQRDFNNGYFSDTYSNAFGDFVLQNDANDPNRNAHWNGGYYAIKPATGNAAALIAEIFSRLTSNRVDNNTSNSAKNWDRAGAAFIVQTMLKKPGGSGYPTYGFAGSDFDKWSQLVTSLDNAGLITWASNRTFCPGSLNTRYMPERNRVNGINDVVFYITPNSEGCESGPVIVFKDFSGNEAYLLRRQCANPIGTINGIDQRNFTITASSAVNNATPAPNDTIQFTHTLTSTGATGSAINWSTQNTLNGNSQVSAGNHTFAGPGAFGVGTENYLVPNGTPAGTLICRRVAFNPANQGGGNGASAQACATVRKAFNLNPTVLPSATNAQNGDTVTFTYKVENTGGNNSDPTQCYVRDTANNPVVVPGLTCAASQIFAYNGGVVTVGSENVTITNQAPGTRICRTLYVNPGTPGGGAKASLQSCIVVAKIPLVRFGGNDVWAGGGFAAVNPACNTSAKITTVGRALSGTVPTQYAGSSVEYNAFALNRITGFGSSGRVLIGNGALGDLSRSMSFANNEADITKLGYYGAAQHCINDYLSLYSSLPLGGALAITNPTSGAWHSASFPSLSGAAPAGVTKVYYSDTDVTITGDITYPASYANVNQIPSILIIAKGNIYVSPGVTRIDAMLVTRGTLFTCYPKPVPATVGNCQLPLTINGAVKATTLDLYRTAGADGVTVPTRQAPAEFFNFSPELYLRNVLNTTSKPSMKVMNSIELPPRY